RRTDTSVRIPRPRQVPIFRTPGSASPGARSPRSAVSGSGTTSTADTAVRGTSTSRTRPASLSAGVKRTRTAVAVDCSVAMPPLFSTLKPMSTMRTVTRMVTAELLLHPVRLRVVQALLGDRVLTTGELHAELPDVPTASLYRHVALLAGAGMLEVADEHRVRGAVERSYRLVPDAVSLGPERMRSLAADEHRRAFAVFTAGLLADYDRYLEG